MGAAQSLPLEAISPRIGVLREKKVLFDTDQAALCGAEAQRLNAQVRRNRARLPEDFAYELTAKGLGMR